MSHKPKTTKTIVFIHEGKRITYEELDYLIRGEHVKYIKSPGFEIPFDIINEIVSYVTKGSTLKSILQSCRYLYEKNKYKIPIFCNHLWTLIKATKAAIPGKRLDWGSITANPNTTLNYIYEYADNFKDSQSQKYGMKKPRKGKRIPAIYPNLKREMLCVNPNITIKEVKELFPKLSIKNINWHSIGITMQDIEDNPDLSPKLSIKNINWHSISKSAGITMQDIEDNPDLRWDLSGVSENPNLTLDFVLRHSNENWAWYLVVKNPGIKMEDIEVLLGFPQMAHASIKFMDVSIEQNPNTTIEFIEKYYSEYRSAASNKICYVKISRDMIEEILKIEVPLQKESKKCDDPMYMYSSHAFLCSQLSRNKNIDIDLVLKYKEFEWHWRALSENPAIKMQDIENNMDLPWFWARVSLNPNLTAQFVIKYSDKNWSWNHIMMNKFDSGR